MPLPTRACSVRRLEAALEAPALARTANPLKQRLSSAAARFVKLTWTGQDGNHHYYMRKCNFQPFICSSRPYVWEMTLNRYCGWGRKTRDPTRSVQFELVIFKVAITYCLTSEQLQSVGLHIPQFPTVTNQNRLLMHYKKRQNSIRS